MPQVVSAVFAERHDAERAVYTLQEIGVPREAISVVARDGEHGHDTGHGGSAAKGALAGLGVGAVGGALFGLAALAIPGVGPFIAAGALAEVLGGVAAGAAASGALLGGAAGGLAGALSRLGVDEREAHHYAGEIERGGTYVGVDLGRAPVSQNIVVEALRRAGGRLDVGQGAQAGPPGVAPGAGEVRVPLTEEVAQVQKVRHQAGEVGVTKRVETETRHISEPVIKADLVTDTREVRAGEQAGTEGRVVEIKPGETLRIQVVEEELIVQKVPRVTREVVIHAQPRVEQVEQDIELRREIVDVHRTGDVDVNAPDDMSIRRS